MDLMDGSMDGRERLTRRPRLETDNRRRLWNPRTELSQCFPSVLMCSETTMISVCQKRVPKACWEAFATIKISLGRLSLFSKPLRSLGLIGPPFPESRSTREIKIGSEKQSETCSLVLVNLGCVQAYFRVLFIYLWIRRPESPVKKFVLSNCVFAAISPPVNGDPSLCWAFFYRACEVVLRRMQLKTKKSTPLGLGDHSSASPMAPYSLVWMRRGVVLERECLFKRKVLAGRGLDARPPGLLLAMYGHIETFSKMPQRLYRLFDTPVGLEPFPSGCRRAAAFVIRIGISAKIWSDLGLIISKTTWSFLIHVVCNGPRSWFHLSLILLSFCYGHPPRSCTSQPKGDELSFCHDRPPRDFRSYLSLALAFALVARGVFDLAGSIPLSLKFIGGNSPENSIPAHAPFSYCVSIKEPRLLPLSVGLLSVGSADVFGRTLASPGHS
ncbi:hypothetical protein CRG98_014124 [Punica granatum]|uniref:Uncharacterized protein n=1 Tax=Punica granatum TaxID=22663 RepID=A0A2I0KCH5_PUNGR|nr:hypothetical protein CRG98_014124 [Punica granatum]